MPSKEQNSFFKKMRQGIRQHQRTIIFIFPLLVVAFYFISVYRNPLYIIQPKPDGTALSFPIFSYTDSLHGGKSTITVRKNTPHELSYRYTLKDGYKYKFAY